MFASGACTRTSTKLCTRTSTIRGADRDNYIKNIGNRRLFYPSPGIDFEVSGVKLDGAGVN